MAVIGDVEGRRLCVVADIGDTHRVADVFKHVTLDGDDGAVLNAIDVDAVVAEIADGIAGDDGAVAHGIRRVTDAEFEGVVRDARFRVCLAVEHVIFDHRGAVHVERDECVRAGQVAADRAALHGEAFGAGDADGLNARAGIDHHAFEGDARRIDGEGGAARRTGSSADGYRHVFDDGIVCRYGNGRLYGEVVARKGDRLINGELLRICDVRHDDGIPFGDLPECRIQFIRRSDDRSVRLRRRHAQIEGDAAVLILVADGSGHFDDDVEGFGSADVERAVIAVGVACEVCERAEKSAFRNFRTRRGLIDVERRRQVRVARRLNIARGDAVTERDGADVFDPDRSALRSAGRPDGVAREKGFGRAVVEFDGKRARRDRVARAGHRIGEPRDRGADEKPDAQDDGQGRGDDRTDNAPCFHRFTSYFRKTAETYISDRLYYITNLSPLSRLSSIFAGRDMSKKCKKMRAGPCRAARRKQCDII